MRYSLPARFLVLLCVVQKAAGQPLGTASLSDVEAAAVDDAIQSAMREDQILGLAIGIIRDREIVYVRGYGLADHERRRPVSTESMFRWASCAKPLAAVAALQLAEQGRLDLDADVRTYVPEFPAKTAPVTTRQILCHQSGIPHYANGEVIATVERYAIDNPFNDPVRALDKFNQSPLLFRPGARESYSSYAYVLLSAVVQRAGGAPFPAQIDARIAKPCGAESLQPDFENVEIPLRVDGLRKLNGRIVPSQSVDVGWKHGAGGYISNVVDMARFARGLIRREFLSEQSEAAMWTVQPAGDGSPTKFGLGIIVDGAGNALRVSHDGSQDKTKTRLVVYPVAGHGMVVMCNCEWAELRKYSTLAYKALGQAQP